MDQHFYAVIMAGGGGTRLWPLSRQARPKQMVQLGRPESLFQVALQRLDGLFPPERILVVTAADHAEQLLAQAPALPPENFLLEPQPRGTAAAIGLAAIALQQRDPQAVMAVLTADHFIGNEVRFRALLAAAAQAARRGWLVTLGIEPAYPATGFGYIQRGESLGRFDEIELFRVLRFKEKPALAQAEQMLAGGDHSWNAGMFIWQVADILAEFARQMPLLAQSLSQIGAAWNTPQRPAVLAELWPQIQKQTIDYGIIEGAQRLAVLPAAGLDWNDVGSWESLYDVLPSDTDGNVVASPQALLLHSQGTLVFAPESRRLIVAIGAQDLIIVDTGDVLLVCPKDQAQNVRQAVDALKNGRQQYL